MESGVKRTTYKAWTTSCAELTTSHAELTVRLSYESGQNDRSSKQKRCLIFSLELEI